MTRVGCTCMLWVVPEVPCVCKGHSTVARRRPSVPPPQQFDSPTVATSFGFLCLVVYLPHPQVTLDLCSPPLPPSSDLDIL
ncbi:hypothetical protein K466DRAFT_379228 [Polyporus arcularius HHB13444]|uniref:Uncharacterized protein n=1 Tax=Polyporus arcularius HHB13444 TaxID=1314778 RepID=A0A5C3PRZ0_9APHY|nr:hypothetical protein K466DRAFT_379228 [Polyporus arcularius HHB13444]